MDQKINIVNTEDGNGNPAGGFVKGVGIDINWQNGPLGTGETRHEPNGAFVEGVLKGLIERMNYYQGYDKIKERDARGKFWCKENEMALNHLIEALMWLNKRTKDREDRGVEGTHRV